MTQVRWLHLSDWHQGAPDLDRRVVRDALIADIEQRAQISGDLAALDVIFFTGDLAWSGQASEYAAASRDFLDEVLRVTAVKKDRLFVIPGNHDFSLARIPNLAERLRVLPETRDQLKAFYENEENREDLLTAFRAYRKWFEGYRPAGFGAFGGARIIPIGTDGTKTVGIVGANSALLCGRNYNSAGKRDDKGYLAIGENQIYDNLRSIQDADLKIGLVHHPFEWLLDFDRDETEGRLLEGCDFVLRGHEHSNRVEATQSNVGNCRLIRGGASYNGRIPERPRYANSYNFVCYDLEAGTGTVYFRVLSDDATK